ncbi:MAG TPA: Nif3-like dinuclear metal center hexameric protein [Armatimonadota bacterium]|nr:Nif3-like dinuclear metal center hexameric protein [Armatimonadota bacterium]
MVIVRDILGQLEQLAPSALAESWDNVGLLIGDAEQPVQKVLVALDATAAVLDQASHEDVQLIITHHPLIFSGMKRLNEDGGTNSLVRRLIREGRSLVATHTNLDSAPDGLNTYVATLLGIQAPRPLIPSEARSLLKLVVYVPETHVDAVRSAICAAGAGHIGHYAECTFGTPGTGTFQPEEGTHPFIGTPGKLERVQEVRLETVVPKRALSAVFAAMFASHPYEEVAYDLFTLENSWPMAGLGRIGNLATPMDAGEFVTRVREVLQTDRLVFTGDMARQIKTVALCTGSGGDFAEHAFQSHADAYLTGEIKHHQALLARQHGLMLIDAGHYPTERPAVNLLAEYLTAKNGDLEIIRAIEEDPFRL